MSLVASVIARVRWIGAANTSKAAVAFSLVSRVSMLVINVLTGVLVARMLGPEGRGTSAAIQMWPILISGLLTFGIPAALRYQVRRRLESPEELFTIALLLTALLGLLSVSVGVFVLPHFLAHYPFLVVKFAIWMMLFAPLMLLFTTSQAFSESQGDFKWASAMLYLPPLLTLAGLVLLISLHRLSQYTIPFVYESSIGIIAVVTLWRLRKSLSVAQKRFSTVKLLLSYGIRAYGMDIINTLAAQVDQAIVVGLLSAADFGLYAVANSGSRILFVLSASFNTVLFPTASALDGLDAIKLVIRSARMVAVLTLAGAIMFIVFLPVLVPLAYGSEYRSVISLAQTLTVAVVFSSATATFAQSFMATGRPEIATILQCVGIVVTIPLMLFLVPRLGLTGASYAVDISAILRFILCMVCYPLFLRHKVPRLLPTRGDIHELFGRLRKSTAF